MNRQLLIIDALNLIRRLDAISLKQYHTEQERFKATLAATTNSIHKLLAQFNPSHVVAVFERSGVDWRNRLYPAYKANRTIMPSHLSQGLEVIQDKLLEQGIDSLLNPEIQADDLIATLASKAAAHALPTVIVSTDHGYWQLLHRHNIEVYDYFKHQKITPDDVLKRYQLPSQFLVDYWALTGNSGVNLSGVPGIGPKTAAKLINKYHHLETLLNLPQGQDKTIDKILNHRSDAKLTYQLMQLVTSLPLGFNLKQLRYTNCLS
ncbi:5'-3' exonuclease H3TH domain-containing protein [Celerinatantimonas diazotrophica]|uniref:Protein Xni n=1 Tax=Celerinatantimonas diazotrophica TaxID=412034 RepID=A0A4R1J9Z5_9GAMM|nr:5'-3' exonuclease H3TH domain-containing protein [Celerinatantimonas diazotrophica]TCK47267.1 protein Xni [Celerinatantimonas diazotrophica]CAG9296039.1 Flap endonuclease Xni [Celerinatantimonas diazotrophica]